VHNFRPSAASMAQEVLVKQWGWWKKLTPVAPMGRAPAAPASGLGWDPGSMPSTVLPLICPNRRHCTHLPSRTDPKMGASTTSTGLEDSFPKLKEPSLLEHQVQRVD
jgi:hypothetical protein